MTGIMKNSSERWGRRRNRLYWNGDGIAAVRARRCVNGAVLENEIELAPGEEKTVYYVLGLTSAKDELVASYGRLIGDCENIVRECFGNGAFR